MHNHLKSIPAAARMLFVFGWEGYSGGDFYEIQNILTRLAQSYRRYATEDTFSAREDISLNMPAIYPEHLKARCFNDEY